MSTANQVPSYTKTDYGHLLRGSDSDDEIHVRKISMPFGEDMYEVSINGETKMMTAEELEKTSFDLGAGDDVFSNEDLDVGVDVVGGEGDDTIDGGSAGDRLRGDSGVDDYSGNSSDRDVINGNDGDDYIGATTGHNTIDSGEGKDIVYDGGERGDQNNELKGHSVFNDELRRFNPDATAGLKEGDWEKFLEEDKQRYEQSQEAKGNNTSTTDESSNTSNSWDYSDSGETDDSTNCSGKPGTSGDGDKFMDDVEGLLRQSGNDGPGEHMAREAALKLKDNPEAQQQEFLRQLDKLLNNEDDNYDKDIDQTNDNEGDTLMTLADSFDKLANDPSTGGVSDDEAIQDEVEENNQDWVDGLPDDVVKYMAENGNPVTDSDEELQEMVEAEAEERGLTDSGGVDGDTDSGDSSGDFDIQNLANSDDWEYVGDGEYMMEGDGYDLYMSQPGGKGEPLEMNYKFTEGELEGAEVKLSYDSDGKNTGIDVDRGDSELSGDEVRSLEKYFKGEDNWDTDTGGSGQGSGSLSESDMDRAMRDAQDATRDAIDDVVYDKQKKKKNGSTTTSQGGEAAANNSTSGGDTTSNDSSGGTNESPGITNGEGGFTPSQSGQTPDEAISRTGADDRGSSYSSDSIDKTYPSGDDGDSSWFLTLAKIMGKMLNDKARQVNGLMEELKGQGENPPYELTAEFQAATQQLSYLQQSFTTAINQLGENIKTGVTAGGASR